MNWRASNCGSTRSLGRRPIDRHVGVTTLCITPASPWENGYNESLNESLCDEMPDGEIFYSFAEARVLIEAWRYYNTICLHSSLGYRLLGSETPSPPLPPSGSASLHLRTAEATGATMH